MCKGLFHLEDIRQHPVCLSAPAEEEGGFPSSPEKGATHALNALWNSRCLAFWWVLLLKQLLPFLDWEKVGS